MAPLLTIISGAQTGVDTAAIKAAIKLQIAYKGWVPLGFTNEAGPIQLEYRASLQETPSRDNAQRTEWNVRESDVLLTILRSSPESIKGGTKWAVDVAKQIGKETWFIDLRSEWSEEKNKVRTWLKGNGVDNMRCAINGPRESEEPGIEELAMHFLCEALTGF
jgi:hypothetical protein